MERAGDSVAHTHPGRAVRLGAAAFTPAVLCMSAPNAIILSNFLDLGYHPRLVLAYIVAFGVALALCAPVFLHAAARRGWSRTARLITWCGAAVLVLNPLGAGSAMLDPPYVAVVGIDLAALGVITVAVARVPQGILFRLLCAVTGVLLAHTCGTHAFALTQRTEVANRGGPTVADADAPHRPAAGNVYHIILDAFQREAFTDVVQRDPACRPPGFTEYTHFTSNYAWTEFSVPHVISGQFLPEGASLTEWTDAAFTNGLWNALATAGVQVRAYPHYRNHCGSDAIPCEAGQDVAPEAWAERVTVDLWFLSLLPRSMSMLLNRDITSTQDAATTEDASGSRRFSVTDAARAGLSGKAVPTISEAPTGGALSAELFTRMLAAEDTRPATGQYTFLHAVLPHTPYVVDRDCRHIGVSTAKEPDAYLDQAQCGLQLIAQLVQRLQALQRYDDALIIVHADHGLFEPLRDRVLTNFDAHKDLFVHALYGQDRDHWIAPDRLARRSAALLLVKFPGATQETASALPAQMMDLAPTILRHFGLPTAAYPGSPLQDMPDAPERERVFYACGLTTAMKMRSPLWECVLENGAWRYRGDVGFRP